MKLSKDIPMRGGTFIVSTLVLFSTLTATAQAQQPNEQLEEVVVTGSHIRGTPEDSASPVKVLRHEELRDLGSPSVLEIVRNLGISAGTDGETNQFASNNLEGTSNINLRGLGAARTLVLINGRRQTFSPIEISDQQMLFVDTNSIPALAIGRIELLKDGAAATYGSDAIAGVANFITRDDFVGIEVRGAYKDVGGGDGDQDFGLIAGLASGALNWVTSIGYNHRSELSTLDKDFALKSITENPQGGISSLGNPVSLSSPNGGFIPDPACEDLGGVVAANICRFQYTFFDNLVEEEDRYQIFSELNYDLSDDTSLHVEFLYAGVDIDSYKTSPSFPPQVFVDPNRLVPSDHPGWISLQQIYPQLVGLDTIDPTIGGVLYRGRVAGVEGPAAVGTRNTDTYRLAANLEGAFSKGWNYDTGFSWSRAEKRLVNPDVQVIKLRDALMGFGGSNCAGTGGTPGANGCEYFNPFSNGIPASAVTGQANPNFDPAVGNSPELRDWLFDDLITDYETELLTLDFTVDGDLGWELGGGTAGFAFGGQYRQEKYFRDPQDLNDLSINPCPIPGDTSCAGLSGLFGFLGGAFFADEDQDIVALFGELALPISDAVNMQLALRYEDYGGDIGDTIDPKVAIRWELSPEFTLRASASTTFRGPTLNQLSGRSTTTAFVPGTGAFKAIVAVGSANLKPESATTFNVGFLGNFLNGRVSTSLDYWSFDFEDSIIVEPFAAVLARAQAGDANYTDQVILGTPGDFSTVEQIQTNIFNGPDIKTSGIDLAINAVVSEAFRAGAELTHISEYEVGTTDLFDSFTPVGQLNSSNFLRPLPRVKGRLFGALDWDRNNVTVNANYVHSYRDERNLFASLTTGQTIDSYFTVDVNYNHLFSNEATRLNLSVTNIADEDPPFARLDLNYDPFTHSPLGRTIKLTVSHHFGAQ